MKTDLDFFYFFLDFFGPDLNYTARLFSIFFLDFFVLAKLLTTKNIITDLDFF